MALSTLVEIVRRAQAELGLPQSAVVKAAVDPQTVQWSAIAQATGDALLKCHPWSFLQTLGTITTVDGTSLYALASDYDRMLQDTAWSRTDQRRMSGPDSPQANRQLLESGTTQASITKRFRLLGTNVSIFPTPDAIETYVYEYVSRNWVLSDELNPQDDFLADTDTTLFDAHLFKAEMKWRFMNAKGMYADGLKAEADTMRDMLIAADLGGTVLSMTPNYGDGQFITTDNIQDGNWT